MPRLPLALLTLVVALASAPAAPRQRDRVGPKPYYPTVPGMTLVFDEDGEERTWEVSAVERGGGEDIVTLTDVSGGSRVTLETVAVSARGVYRLSGGRFRFDPHPILKFPVRAGTAWDFYLAPQKDLPSQRGTTTIGPVEDVDTPAGRFRAVRVDMVLTEHGGKGVDPPHLYTKWHHPDLGQVKITGPDGFCRVLTAVTYPRDKD